MQLKKQMTNLLAEDSSVRSSILNAQNSKLHQGHRLRGNNADLATL